MPALKTTAWIAVGVACLHGFMFLQTEEVHPCKAAGKRLLQDYGVAAIGVSMKLGFEALLGDGRPGSPSLGRSSPEEREILAKTQTLDNFGVIGCYPPAVLGWKVIPPYR